MLKVNQKKRKIIMFGYIPEYHRSNNMIQITVWRIKLHQQINWPKKGTIKSLMNLEILMNLQRMTLRVKSS
ncbi:MAG: hypothetical protein ABR84_01830 [Cryomorphaceae bacterium BACL21 MAG-121220-bin10]|nr:MAG: hypothetical protein ABR84_01830 [Cryomorphaceae bacterium BACL21 MAG-121220-bin10]